MTAALRTTAVGVFVDHGEAERAVDDLLHAGFADGDIGFIARRPPDADAPAHGPESHAAEGAAVGAATGGVIGTATGLAMAAGLLSPIGPVVAGGLLLGVLVSAVAGVAVGGLIGALTGLGIPEEEATYYEKELREGRYLVTVKAGQRYDDAVAILKKRGAYGKGTPLI